MLVGFLLVIAGILLSACVGAAGVAFVRHVCLPWIRDLVDVHVQSQLALLEGRFDEVEQVLADLPKTYAEERDESRRLRQRATYHVRRARAELAELNLEDGELEGLAGELRLIDGTGGSASGLQQVPGGVEETAKEGEKSVMTRAFEHKWGKKYG